VRPRTGPAKLADARLAELIAAVESGREIERSQRPGGGLTLAELAERWQQANRPRRNQRTADWIGWSPKTAKTHADNFRLYILPALGARDAATLTALDLDDLHVVLEEERGLSVAVVVRCHSQVRAMFSWALRKKLVTANPALAADPPKLARSALKIPTMSDVRAVQEIAARDFAAYVQVAATVGARRGTLVALRWGSVDLDARRVTFSHSIAESTEGLVEKGTKADRPYCVALGGATADVLGEHRPAGDREGARGGRGPGGGVVRVLRRRWRHPLGPLGALARLAALFPEGGRGGSAPSRSASHRGERDAHGRHPDLHSGRAARLHRGQHPPHLPSLHPWL
jgi:integrase